MDSYSYGPLPVIIDSCIELAVARHMCGMLNQNVHRTFWLKHNPVVSPGQVFERVFAFIPLSLLFNHVGFIGRRVGSDFECFDPSPRWSGGLPCTTSGPRWKDCSWSPGQDERPAGNHLSLSRFEHFWQWWPPTRSHGHGDSARRGCSTHGCGRSASRWPWSCNCSERRLPRSRTGAAGPEGGRVWHWACWFCAARDPCTHTPTGSLVLRSGESCIQ